MEKDFLELLLLAIRWLHDLTRIISAAPAELSDEQKQRLNDAWVRIYCDFLACVQAELCPPRGIFDRAPGDPDDVEKVLERCIDHAICQALAHVREALCPPEPPRPRDTRPRRPFESANDLPCNFAVE